MEERDQYAESHRRENLVEHCLVAELLQDAWMRRGQSLDILRSEVDAAGHDLVLVCNGTTRHVQVKSSKRDSRTGFQPVNGRLAEVIGGCVVWARVKEIPETHRIDLTYWFYGNAPGELLDGLAELRLARHTRANATGHKPLRENAFRVNKGLFRRLADIAELSDALFGSPPPATVASIDSAQGP